MFDDVLFTKMQGPLYSSKWKTRFFFDLVSLMGAAALFAATEAPQIRRAAPLVGAALEIKKQRPAAGL